MRLDILGLLRWAVDDAFEAMTAARIVVLSADSGSAET
jgi:hypothetical protein